MPSIRSESDLYSLAPPPTLRVTSLDLTSLRCATPPANSSSPLMPAAQQAFHDVQRRPVQHGTLASHACLRRVGSIFDCLC
jgi:hypothetical protein